MCSVDFVLGSRNIIQLSTPAACAVEGKGGEASRFALAMAQADGLEHIRPLIDKTLHVRGRKAADGPLGGECKGCRADGGEGDEGLAFEHCVG